MNSIVIKIIYDNCKSDENFQAGWGFSCLVDLGVRKILFDTGADSSAFFSNLQNFGIACEQITHIVYSHKHSDHVAGFDEVVKKLKKNSRLFLPKTFPSRMLPLGIQTEIVEDMKEIDSGVYTLVLKGGFLLYEQALLLDTKKGIVVITGCAHPGIVRLLKEVKNRLHKPIYMVLGGFHLFNNKLRQIEEIIEQFKILNVQIAAPCHCSGDRAIEQFKQAFGDCFYKVGAGTLLTLDGDSGIHDDSSVSVESALTQ